MRTICNTAPPQSAQSRGARQWVCVRDVWAAALCTRVENTTKFCGTYLARHPLLRVAEPELYASAFRDACATSTVSVGFGAYGHSWD